MRMKVLTMNIRWFYQRHRIAILFVVFVFLLIVAAYCYHLKLLYFENNLPFSSRTISVPFHAEYQPDKGKIPRIIHQTWKTTAVPKHFSTYMQSWQEKHPSFEYWFWTDSDARRLISSKYPEFLALYDSYPYNIQRADVMRYFILYEYGGIYSDLDVEVEKPIDPLLKESCYLSQEPLEHAFFFWGKDRLACNAIMACRPRHPFFKQVLENLKYYKGLSIAPLLRVAMPVMESSGPKMITVNLDTYQQDSSQPITNPVHLWPVESFFPDADPATLPYVKNKCKSYYRSTFKPAMEEVCQYHEKTGYTNPPHDGFYAKHHWSHTYYGLEKKQVVAIKKLNRDVRLAAEVLDDDKSVRRDVQKQTEMKTN